MAAKEVFIRTFLGKTVIDSEAKTIGKIKDMVMSTEDWSITEVHIKIDSAVKKELELGGFGSKTVKSPTSYVKRIGDVVNLTVPVNELVKICELI